MELQCGQVLSDDMTVLRSRRTVVAGLVAVAAIVTAVFASQAGASSSSRGGCYALTSDKHMVSLGECSVDTPHVTMPRQVQQPTDMVTVPNVVGLPLGVAAADLNEHGLRARSTGGGQVVRQVPAPGVVVVASEVVELTGST